MENEKKVIFSELFESLINETTKPGNYDVDNIYDILAKLCKLFRISKGTTEFYASTAHEKAGKGNVLVCYDDGMSSRIVLEKRVVTKSMTVAKCCLYQSDAAMPLDEEESAKAELVMRSVLSFVSRNRLESIVERLTFYDDNGYPNLRAFLRWIERASEEGRLAGHTAVHFNLRHFGLINQEIGRNSGDVVIHNYFAMIEKVIDSRGIVCRLGGDNFVAIFDSELLGQILGILRGVPVLYDVNEQKRIMVSASTGVFAVPEGFEYNSTSDIMDKILSASQAARTGQADSIVFYDDKILISKEKVNRVQQMFPEGIRNKEFKVYYQPKIDIATGNIVGAEALCRWLHDGRTVPPMEFIPILERNTDICRLDFYMLDLVCKDIRRWLDEGRKVVRVSVNLSRKHMMDVDLLEHIMKIVDDNNVPHQFIEIELTETTTDVEFRDLKRVVSGLQQAGICTSVDDFGMGYSSLNLIREIPWNVLKVDRSFLPVEEDNDKSTRSIMFKYVVAMAKELGLECIAEGVETKSQVDVLRDNSCFYAQGFFFDKPLPIDEFENRLDTHHYDIGTGAVG